LITDLHDHEVVLRPRRQERQRHPQLIVEALRALGASQRPRGQYLVDEVARRRLPVAAGDADDTTAGGAQHIPPAGCKGLKRGRRGLDPQERQAAGLGP